MTGHRTNRSPCRTDPAYANKMPRKDRAGGTSPVAADRLNLQSIGRLSDIVAHSS